jgi:hypothetical protein
MMDMPKRPWLSSSDKLPLPANGGFGGEQMKAVEL